MVRALNGLLLTLAVSLLAGCGKSEPATPSPQTTAAQPAVEAPTPPPQPAMPPQPVTPPPEPVREKAAVGAVVQGHGYGTGPVATPMAIMYRAKEHIAFDIQIPHALDLFKATEGRLPKSHEEFMERIIKENQIKLPPLPEGQRYVYDVKQGQLMIGKQNQ